MINVQFRPRQEQRPSALNVYYKEWMNNVQYLAAETSGGSNSSCAARAGGPDPGAVAAVEVIRTAGRSPSQAAA